MRKSLIALVVVMLLASACGGGKKESTLTGSSGPEASAGAAASAAPGKSAAPAKSGGSKPASGASSAGSSSAGTTAAAPKPKVVAGGYAQPKNGKYVYNLSGESTNPFNPAAPPQKFENETLTKSVSNNGNVVTTEQSTSTQAGKSTQKTRWESNRILLLSVATQTPQGDFSCEFNPPLVIAHFPVHPETFPTQNFKGSGNACNGKLDIQIVRRESAKDANGKSWDAWRVRVQTQASAGQFTQTSDDTRWVAPVLAEEVATSGTFTYKISGTGGAQSGHGSTSSKLKSYPK